MLDDLSDDELSDGDLSDIDLSEPTEEELDEYHAEFAVFYSELVDAYAQLLKGWLKHPRLAEVASTLGIAPSAMEQEESLRSVVEAVVAADLLRVAANAINPGPHDDFSRETSMGSFLTEPRCSFTVSGSEVFFGELASKLAQVRPEYERFGNLTRYQIPELIQTFKADRGRFGFLDLHNRWIGNRLHDQLRKFATDELCEDQQGEDQLGCHFSLCYSLSHRLCDSIFGGYAIDNATYAAMGKIAWPYLLNQFSNHDVILTTQVAECLLFHFEEDRELILQRLDQVLDPKAFDEASIHAAVLRDVLPIRCRCFAEMNRVLEAERDFQATLRLSPEIVDSEFWIAYARMRSRAGDSSMVRAFRLAYRAISLYDHREVIDLLQRAVSLAPSVYWLRNALAWAIASGPDATSQECEQALVIIDGLRSLRDQPYHRWLCTRAAILARMGRFDEAVLVIDQAVRVREDSEFDPLHSTETYQVDRELYQSRRCFDAMEIDFDALTLPTYVMRSEFHPLRSMQQLASDDGPQTIVGKLWKKVSPFQRRT